MIVTGIVLTPQTSGGIHINFELQGWDGSGRLVAHLPGGAGSRFPSTSEGLVAVSFDVAMNVFAIDPLNAPDIHTATIKYRTEPAVPLTVVFQGPSGQRNFSLIYPGGLNYEHANMVLGPEPTATSPGPAASKSSFPIMGLLAGAAALVVLTKLRRGKPGRRKR